MGKLKKSLKDVVKMLKDHPEKGSATFSVDTQLMEGYKCDVHAQDFQFYVDEPTSLGGTNQGVNPVTLLLASLATCQEITFRVFNFPISFSCVLLSI